MDEIRCSIKIEDRAEGKPARLTGVLMVYGQQATDRPERFEVGALQWDADAGIVLNRQHNRAEPILRLHPVEVGGSLVVDEPVPDTSAGRDCLAEIRSGLFRGLSIEFKSIKEALVNGVRVIYKSTLVAAGLVDRPAYSGSLVEARAKAEAKAEWDRWRREVIA